MSSGVMLPKLDPIQARMTGKSVWYVNRCNPELNGGGGWGIFNALLGWTTQLHTAP
jgi:high-affinity Fe2+/Pb2+ permease